MFHPIPHFLVAPEVIKMTNVGAANDANLVKINISFSVYKHTVNESI